MRVRTRGGIWLDIPCRRTQWNILKELLHAGVIEQLDTKEEIEGLIDLIELSNIIKGEDDDGM